jgi:hypothetical protein
MSTSDKATAVIVLREQAKSLRSLADRLEEDASMLDGFNIPASSTSEHLVAFTPHSNGYRPLRKSPFAGTPRKETMNVLFEVLKTRKAHKTDLHKVLIQKGIEIKLDTMSFYLTRDERFKKSGRGFWTLTRNYGQKPLEHGDLLPK